MTQILPAKRGIGFNRLATATMKVFCKSLFAICLVLFGMSSCTSHPSDKVLHDKIIGKLKFYEDGLNLRKEPYTIVNMDKLTSVDWDCIYLFKENSDYPTDEEMSQVMGIKFSGSTFLTNSIRLIFTKGNKIAAVVDFSQDEGDNIWLYGGASTSNGAYNLDGRFLRKEGVEFAFYPECSYRKVYMLTPFKEFDANKALSGEFYKPCY